MSNSRMKLRADDDKPHNSSKGKGIILETPYKPGFVDDKDLETVKMAVDKELSDISNAFYETIERTADTITRVDKLEIAGDTQWGELVAKIEEVDRVSKEGDQALASRITTISAEIGDNKAAITTESEARVSADEALSKRIDTVSAEFKTADDEIKASVTTEATARANADQALAGQITTVKSELEGQVAEVRQYTNTEVSKVDGKVNTLNAKWGVSVDVNGNVAGVELNNGTGGSEFKVLANRFYFTDGNTVIPPFAVVGNVVHMSNVVIRGTLYAEDIVGDVASEFILSSTGMISLPTDYAPWVRFRVNNPRHYPRTVIANTGVVTPQAGHTSGEALFRIGPDGTGEVWGTGVVRSEEGETRPIIVIGQVPPNWSGVVTVSCQKGQGGPKIIGGAGSVRMFRNTGELGYY